jgi:biopolymer transport protein ExbD
MSEKVKQQIPEPERKPRRELKFIDIDMNPMVDLAFLLLTFFMLTTTFNQPQAMELVMPAKPKPEDQVKEQPVKESRTLTFILGENDALFYYRGITDAQLESVEWGREGLRKLLLNSNRDIDKMVVIIKPHPGSNFRNLVDMLDELNIVGAERYAIDDFGDFDEKLLEDFK